MNTQTPTALQPVAVKSGDYEISVTPDALSAIAETKEYSMSITRRLDQLTTTFIDMARGIPQSVSAEGAIAILGDLQFIRERITALAAINILRDGEPVNVEL